MTLEDVLKDYGFHEYSNEAEALKDVFEYFESKTCATCRHKMQLDFQDNEKFRCKLHHSNNLINSVTKDFGCNKWEKKT